MGLVKTPKRRLKQLLITNSKWVYLEKRIPRYFTSSLMYFITTLHFSMAIWEICGTEIRETLSLFWRTLLKTSSITSSARNLRRISSGIFAFKVYSTARLRKDNSFKPSCLWILCWLSLRSCIMCLCSTRSFTSRALSLTLTFRLCTLT